MKTIVLIGYRCTGKTTVGKKLAERLGCPFMDTDERIVSKEGKTVAEIVSEGGWPLFRQGEREVLAAVDGSEHMVLATGGGIIESVENREQLHKMGLVVWLTAPPDVIEQRLVADENTAEGRPPLSGLDRPVEIEETLARREPLYKETAHLVVDSAGQSIQDMVEEILKRRNHKETG